MDSYQLKWHSHANHLNGSVAALLRSEKFTDVVLCTLDGCQIPAHKFILSSCSIYLNTLFENQKPSLRSGVSTVYIVLPSEITTKALQVLIEYMYKGETTVSNDILDTVLKAGDLLKVRGLWRQNEGRSAESTILNKSVVEKTTEPSSTSTSTLTSTTAKQTNAKKPDATETQLPKISVKKDDKLLKTYTSLQHLNLGKQTFIGPPKLVFIKTSNSTQTLRAIAPKPQTIIVTPDLQPHMTEANETNSTENQENHQEHEVKYRKNDKKYGKKSKIDDTSIRNIQRNQEKDSESNDLHEMIIKEEPIWDDNDEIITETDLFDTEITIKPEIEDMLMEEIEEEEQIYSPLTCELCSEVFHIPAEWVRHIQVHAAESTTQSQSRKRKSRTSSDDGDEATALLRCDLCQKLFPNPAEWVRHIQNTHTETELAICNNSTPPRRHNRFTEGDQKKTCDHCKKVFPSHASMVIHLRTHTGERPFICGLCNKGFNVKSNLLRHLRTLHDTMVSPGNVPLLQEDLVLSQSIQVINKPSSSTSTEIIKSKTS